MASVDGGRESELIVDTQRAVTGGKEGRAGREVNRWHMCC